MADSYLFTDWIEVCEGRPCFLAKVFLGSDDSAYMIVKGRGKVRLFAIPPSLLRLDDHRFVEKAMKCAKELPLEKAVKEHLFLGCGSLR
jgi:hypothetical protein